MVVRLRLALPPTNLRRPDHRTFPRFNIVAIESQTRRDAKPIEKLGEWGVVRRKVSKPGDKVLQSISPEFVDGGKGKGKAREGVEEAEQTLPFDAKTGDRRGRLEKRVIWNVDRINYWLGTGAQPSERVAWLLDQAGLIPKGKYKGVWSPEHNTSAATPQFFAYLKSEERKRKELIEAPKKFENKRFGGPRIKLPSGEDALEVAQRELGVRIDGPSDGRSVSQSP